MASLFADHRTQKITSSICVSPLPVQALHGNWQPSGLNHSSIEKNADAPFERESVTGEYVPFV
jgi:hypothetical protein